MRIRRDGLVLLLAAVIVAGALVDEATARRPRPRFVATVGGKRFKGWRRATRGAYSTTSFTVGASTRPRRGLLRTIAVSCAGLDLRAVALPVMPTAGFCSGIYQEQNLRTGLLKTWGSLGLEVTVSAFDGTRVVGTVRGVIQPGDPADAPVSLEEGAFAMMLLDVGV